MCAFRKNESVCEEREGADEREKNVISMQELWQRI